MGGLFQAQKKPKGQSETRRTLYGNAIPELGKNGGRYG